MFKYVIDFNGKEFISTRVEGNDKWEIRRKIHEEISLREDEVTPKACAENSFKSIIESSLKELNEAYQSGKLSVHQCKDCGKYFILSQEEFEWFSSRGLVSPKRCRLCRYERKHVKKGA